jgi:hypothetical protein
MQSDFLKRIFLFLLVLFLYLVSSCENDFDSRPNYSPGLSQADLIFEEENIFSTKQVCWYLELLNYDIPYDCNLNDVVNHIDDSTELTLIIDKSLPAGLDTIVPQNINLNFYNGNRIILDEAVLLINGLIRAEAFKIFEQFSNNSVLFNPAMNIEGHMSWWGNDSDALQSAFNSNLNHIVIDYSFESDSTIFYPEGIIIEGKPRMGSTTNGVKITFTGSGSAFFPLNAETETGTSSLIVRDLMIDGSENTNDGIIGWNASGVKNSRFDNLFIYGFGESSNNGIGFFLKGIASSARGNNNLFLNCQFSMNDIGVILTGIPDAKANSNQFDKCDFTMNGIGIEIILGTNNLITGGRLEGNFDTGAIIRDFKNVIIGVRIEWNPNYGIYLPADENGFGLFLFGNLWSLNGTNIFNPKPHKIHAWEQNIGMIVSENIMSHPDNSTHMQFSLSTPDFHIGNDENGNVLNYIHHRNRLQTDQVFQITSLSGIGNRPLCANDYGKIIICP